MNQQKFKRSSLANFLNIHRILCQTQLVDELLKKDKQLDLFNNVHNLYEYKAQLSNGIFRGTVDQYVEKRHNLEVELSHFRTQLNKQKSATYRNEGGLNDLIESLMTKEKDLIALDNADEKEKTIFEWWLIPYWLAEMLMEKGEVVFQHFGCSWWGQVDLAPVWENPALLDILKKLDCPLL